MVHAVTRVESRSDPIRVLVVDDDPMVRASLRVMLGGADDIEVVSLLADGDEVTENALVDVDVILMDIIMARMDGLTATSHITARSNHPHVIVLTTFDAEDYVLEALRHGASGFLLKDTDPGQIVDAIRRVVTGEPMLSGTVTRQLMTKIKAESDTRVRAQDRLKVLSERELEIARAIGRGLSNNEIAAELFVAVATVKTHIGQIFTKTKASSRVQIAILVHEAGFPR
jgi:DNA-binding NarL/FixJ family response regulator